jgi:hypothetical protein
MMMTRNLEVTHHVDGNVAVVKELTRDVHENVKETKQGAYVLSPPCTC